MTRANVIQALLDGATSARYLEIGARSGAVFLAVRANRKVAVKRQLDFDREAGIKAGGVVIHECGACAYFGGLATRDEHFGVIFLRRQRGAEGTLRNYANAIAYLDPGGAIVIEGVSSKRRKASDPAPQASGSDRIGPFIETFFQGWRCARVAESPELLVIWRERRPATATRTVAEIAALAPDGQPVPTSPVTEIIAGMRRGA